MVQLTRSSLYSSQYHAMPNCNHDLTVVCAIFEYELLVPLYILMTGKSLGLATAAIH
jgi:hypothetical protein